MLDVKKNEEDGFHKAVRRLKTQLSELEKKHTKEFFAHTMYLEAKERNLRSDKIEEIIKKYGEYRGGVVIEFDKIGVDGFRYFDQAVEIYLKEKGYQFNPDKSSEDNFINYMLEKERNQAKIEIGRWL